MSICKDSAPKCRSELGLTQLNQLQGQNAGALIEKAVSYKFQKMEMGCGETIQLSFCCYVSLSILEET